MWHNIIETDNKYSISEDGQVKNNSTEHILKPFKHHKGYLKYRLDNKNYFIHRLVALYYIPNPNNYPQVNHKDGNKANNHFSNLEWCTNSMNHQHSIITGLRKYKLNKQQAEHIKVSKNVVSAKQLAQMYNVATITIYKIWEGRFHT